MAGLQWPILGLRGPISGSRGPIQGPGPSKVSGGGGTRFCLREGVYSTRPFHGQFHTRRQSSGCAAVYKGKDQISQINRHELSQSLAAPDSSVNLSVASRKYLLGPNMTFSGLR